MDVLKGRMGPFISREYLTLFPAGFLAFNSIITLVLTVNIWGNFNVLSKSVQSIYIACLVTYCIHFLFTFLFMLPSFRLIFGKMQMIFVCWVTFVAAHLCYMFYFFLIEIDRYHLAFFKLALFLFLGGLGSLAFYLIRAFRSINKDTDVIRDMRNYNLPKNKHYIVVPVLYFVGIIFLMRLIEPRWFELMGGNIGVLYFLALSFILHYVLCIIFSEFVLYTYLLLKYPIAIDEIPDVSRATRKANSNIIDQHSYLHTVIAKILQYPLLFIVAIFIPFAIVGSTVVIGSLIYFICWYLLLKWMSRYKISIFGIYLIKSMLSLSSSALIFTYIAVFSGKDIDHMSLEWWMDGVILIAPLFFWFNFDVVGRLRDRENAKLKKNNTVKNKVKNKKKK